MAARYAQWLAGANARLNAFTSVTPPSAWSGRGAGGHGATASGATGAGAGVRISIKDNICTVEEDGPSTAASLLLDDYVSPFEAKAVAALKAALPDAVMVGKTNLDEFGMGAHSQNSAAGPVVSPWHPARSPGGSSGGAGVSVAINAAHIALGSDTGGSVRLPAAYNGIIGIKPTYGLVSRRGLISYASSMDTIGVLAAELGMAATGLDAIAGFDADDATSCQAPDAITALGSYADAVEAAPELAGKRIGLPRSALIAELAPEVKQLWREAARSLEAGGASVEWIELPSLPVALAAYYVIAAAEAASNLSRYDGLRYGNGAAGRDTVGYDAVVRKRILLGTHVLSAAAYAEYYVAAGRVRADLAAELAAAFGHVDALLLPTAPTPPPRIDGTVADDAPLDHELAAYANDVFTVPANLAGLPAFSLPLGTASTADGILPLGMQLIGPAFSEHTLFGLSAHLLDAFAHAAPLSHTAAWHQQPYDG
ncbi:aspartyl/glutamyl-tRNA(Asn/Gln) amidotransferase subunit A [Thecamonas trahens ATCC 50062]|uniref:Glutamyl-tRNA(Gln) amidotransferase subunit A, mitochondrial n=1 Tax=Thecamonas trahens ATCC 50062 TaxID=461836 RepID=A0A0L0DKE2_THETB|nr:aspartyl/glutamyl-tRNA(Asn/Gln) amidotransferase subunit A [Thecamonas trahens ATCC 50062]KNC52874.1 aspartyl/glutamyl-tRNA(Asn/Gln) amidotransferase subunit A [Thecamonas trahens ATCC 50062]|eukprot:XP_013754973.1 aspartyl/glutamyl-tRNA(Asn/Gln) amidotransferase subunit A [Thecamonas trahens ATCC 50062]